MAIYAPVAAGNALGDLFNAINQGPAIRDAASRQLSQQQGDQQKLQEENELLQNRLTAQKNLGQSIATALGLAPDVASGLAGATIATNSNDTGIGNLFAQSRRQAALQRAGQQYSLGDLTGTGAAQLQAGEQPIAQTRVADNTAYSPNTALGKQTLRTTPYGQTDLSQKATRISAQNAAEPKAPKQPDYTKLDSVQAKFFQIVDPNTGVALVNRPLLAAFYHWAGDNKEGFASWLVAHNRAMSDPQRTFTEARAALIKGASREGVMTRLQELGFSPEDIAKANL